GPDTSRRGSVRILGTRARAALRSAGESRLRAFALLIRIGGERRKRNQSSVGHLAQDARCADLRRDGHAVEHAVLHEFSVRVELSHPVEVWIGDALAAVAGAV